MEETREPTQMRPTPRGSNNLGIPVAIVIAAALIAGAIYLSGGSGSAPQATNNGTESETQVTPEVTIEPVTETDHIRGNPNAPIMLVEYSDYDCPFCKNFHVTMNQVMEKYGAEGKVAWVYRHFPLEQLHPNAPRIAAASECVAELAGNDAFWTFSDLVFEERSTNEPTDLTRLSEFAATAGTDREQFELCLNSGKYNEQIQQDVEAAIAAGGRGTPHTIVLVGDQQGVINGAQPFGVVDQIVESLLAQIETTGS